MSQTPIYQVDAFTDKIFGGNPAAVCPLNEWLDDKTMQSIAIENNLAETVFFVKEKEGYHIRWFTPEYEINLCGHATLASAFVLFHFLGHTGNTVQFRSKSGMLSVEKKGELLTLDFPAWPAAKVQPPAGLFESLRIKPSEVYKHRDYMIVLESEKEVLAVDPDFEMMKKINAIGIMVTAKGDSCDFVSRFFAPGAGIPEDPVTGSAHCSLIPYWAEKLGKNTLHAFQLSKRRGELFCGLHGDRVKIGGKAVCFMKGEIEIGSNGK